MIRRWPQSPLAADERRPALLLDLRPRMWRGPIVARCGCGRVFTARQWARLECRGVMEDDVETVELRQCVCDNTLALPLTRPVPARLGWGDLALAILIGVSVTAAWLAGTAYWLGGW